MKKEDPLKLFSAHQIGPMQLKNRLVMAPMCMYAAANDARATNFHTIHYATRAIGQVGLIIIEATGVSPQGRISNKDLGLWSDDQIEPLQKIVKTCQKYGSKVAIQLGHAGRKSTVPNMVSHAPSAIDFDPKKYETPTAMTQADIEQTIQDFVDAAKRAVKAGVDGIEIHAAHGYLIHEFLSPLSNTREDSYGGSLENRSRILQEIVIAIKKAIPQNIALWMRISATDYLPNGLICQDLETIVNSVKASIDCVHVSSGGLLTAPIKLYPGYQVKFAEQIKKNCDIPVIGVGLLQDPPLVHSILEDDRIDFVALGRPLLRSPHWLLDVASQNQVLDIIPKSYERGFK